MTQTTPPSSSPQTGEWSDAKPHSVSYAARPHLLFSTAVWMTAHLGGVLQDLFGSHSRHGFGVLMYHRTVEHVPGVARPTVNVTPKRLRHQLTGLLARGFEAWPLSRLLEAQREGQAVPSNAFAVTFDDGYENNYTRAWPVLRELNVPATIFLATRYLDSSEPFPFDEWPAAGSSCVPASAWRPLSTRQCAEMLAGGLIELGAHTHTHRRFLGRCSEFKSDLAQSLDLLRDRFGILRPAFAFPFGDTSEELFEAALELGVRCCLSTRRRRVNRGDDPSRWGRFRVEHSDSPAVLAAKLSGWYTTLAAGGKALAGPFAAVTGTAGRQSASRRRPPAGYQMSEVPIASSQP